MQAAIRYFNTSGPNRRDEHYTLEREDLMQIGLTAVHRSRYFTIWAPRQTGKSTFFILLAERLEREGYKVCWVNFENFATEPLQGFLDHFLYNLNDSWGLNLKADSVTSVFSQIMTIQDKKFVLVVDEVEGINPEYFSNFLHGIRNAYHKRDDHALKSVILVGVSNITGIVQDNASPFNISDSIQVGFFTREETFELFAQHERETGQLFAPEVKEKVYQISAGQPGLVNGFGLKLTERFPTKPVITYEDYLVVEDWYLYKALDKNVANVINKAKKHQKFLEEILFLERKVKFDIDKEHIRFFHINGLIKEDEQGNVIFWVPLYKKRLQKYFYPSMNGEAEQIMGHIGIEAYLTPAKSLDMDKVIRGYQEYAARRGFRYFIERDEKGHPKGLREAALMYSFETYIQAFLQVFGGKSYMEPHIGLGRSDLVVNVRNHESVIEAKIFNNITQFADGKAQLAYYANSIGLKKAYYLVFANAIFNNPALLESDEVMEGVEIKTYIVKYDLEKDFTEPRKKRK